MINENIAYAKSILTKNGITLESPEYQDYLKIREICGNDHGYVGILTKLRFVDTVTDMDELKSIYEILKKSKFDFAKLNKLTYQQILELFYDELSGDKVKNEDIELIYKDSSYSYYRVYTYKGILKIGSPAWCLKTKTMWDKYQNLYPVQWVAIDNKYKNNLITPDNTYLSEYKSAKGYIRFGICLKKNDDDSVSWQAFSDSNGSMNYTPDNHTFFGVMSTILNINYGHKESYYQYFPGCDPSMSPMSPLGTRSSWLKVNNKKFVCKRLSLSEDYFKDEDEVSIGFSEGYCFYPIILVLNKSQPNILRTIKTDSIYTEIVNKKLKSILEEYALRSTSEVYLGVKLKLGKITMSEIEKNPKYVGKVDRWLIFSRNDKYYLIVNSELKEYQVPTRTLKTAYHNMTDPMYWYFDRETKTPYKDVSFDGIIPVINFIKDIQEEVIPAIVEEPKTIEPGKTIPDETRTMSKTDEPEKKVKGFWDFLKGKKE